MATVVTEPHLRVDAPDVADAERVLTPEALAFVAELHRRFEERRRGLLARRAERRARLDGGATLGWLPETERVRRDPSWRVAPAPADLRDRRVEITGPPERKIIVNAMNSGARVFMADFEDSNAPTWRNLVTGQANLMDAVRRTIDFTTDDGREYRLGTETATLVVRPRGWHLFERHLVVDGSPVSASLFDAGLYLHHNARELFARGSGPYLYLPKLESHLEARLWNDVFVVAEALLGLPRGTIRATVLVETIFAAFEMEEILYELREHSAGLNCGRWDYLFSVIKTFQGTPGFALADRALLTMTSSFMRAYSLLTIRTCHRRGAHAIGGMAAQIPSRDPAANERALARVRADKEREADDGHDGTWVAHPGLVPVARDAFDRVMPGPDQLGRRRDDVDVAAADLLDFEPRGPVTEAGIRTNAAVAIRYLGAWLESNGCVAINGLMEDLATAEISRSQLWQWVHGDGVVLADGRPVTAELVVAILDEELAAVLEEHGSGGRYEEAAALLADLTTRRTLVDFLSLAAEPLLEQDAAATIA